MPTRLSASGRADSPASSLGNGSGSVFALQTFWAINSASSVRLIREKSDGSDLDIFLVPSRSDITRVAGPVITGSVNGRRLAEAMLADGGGKVIVEFLSDVAGQFQMLFLILAHRNVGRPVGQNIRGHQNRIGVQPNGSLFAVLSGLLLELRHPAQPADPRHAVEDPGQLGVLGNLALIEHDMFLGIDTAGKKCRSHFPDGLREFGRILPERNRMQINDAVDAVVVPLQSHKLADRSEIVSQMQVAGRLHPRKDPFGHHADPR